MTVRPARRAAARRASVVLLVSIAAVRLAVGIGLPSLLLYLGLGLLLGENGLGGLEFDDARARRRRSATPPWW